MPAMWQRLPSLAAAGALAWTLVAPAGADTAYRWVDPEGKTTYQDAPPPQEAVEVEVYDLPDAGPVPGDEPQGPPPVVLYTVPGCLSCDAARDYLKRRGITFQEINVEGDPAAQKAMKDKVGALAVPTLLIGNRVLKGFVEVMLERELQAAGYPPPEPPLLHRSRSRSGS